MSTTAVIKQIVVATFVISIAACAVDDDQPTNLKPPGLTESIGPAGACFSERDLPTHAEQPALEPELDASTLQLEPVALPASATTIDRISVERWFVRRVQEGKDPTSDAIAAEYAATFEPACQFDSDCPQPFSGKLHQACYGGLCVPFMFTPGPDFCVDVTTCGDDSACTADDCTLNTCAHAQLNCIDDNPCNSDSCDATVGCLHDADVRIGSPTCNDDNPDTLDVCGIEKDPKNPKQKGRCWHQVQTDGTWSAGKVLG